MNETSFSGFLGIDVSKDKFDAYCIDITGEKHFYLSCPLDRTGFEKLVSRLGALSIPQESLLIGMESTACYHMNLFSFLLAGGYTAVIINPLLISNFVKMQLRKTKTDKKDALVIAQLLRNDESFKGADPQTEDRCVDSSGGPSERTDGHDD